MSAKQSGRDGDANVEAGILELSALLAEEARAHGDREQSDALFLRLSLVCWVALGDVDAALRYVDEVSNQTAEIWLYRRALLLASSNRAAFQAHAERVVEDGPLVGRLECRKISAETLLFLLGDPMLARDPARDAGRRPDAGADAQLLAFVSLDGAGDRSGLVQFLQTRRGASLCRFRLAALLADSEEKPAEAGRLFAESLSESGDDAYFLERLWELTLRRPKVPMPAEWDREALLKAKVDTLSDASSAVAETDAARYLLSDVLMAQGRWQDADRLLVDLVQAEGHWGGSVALQRRRQLAVEQGDWKRVSDIYHLLSVGCGDVRWKRAYELRSVEAGELAGLPVEQLVDRCRSLVVSGEEDLRVISTSARMMLSANQLDALADLFENAGARPGAEFFLRWASLLWEGPLEDKNRACELRWSSAPIAEANLVDALDLVRLSWETGRWERLHEAFLAAARASGADKKDGDLARKVWSALWTLAAGLAAVRQGAGKDAEQSLVQAMELDETDAVSAMTLALLHSRSERWKEAAELLKKAAGQLRSRPVKIHALRELGRIAGAHLGDFALAEKTIKEALEFEPDDPSLLHELALIADKKGDSDRGLELRRRAAELLGSSFRAAVLWTEIGDHFQRSGDLAAAEEAFVRALDIDEGQQEVLEKLSQIYRQQERWLELLETLQVRLEVGEGDRGKVRMEAADVILKAGLDPRKALEHYRAVLIEEPANDRALVGLERLCRRHGWWAELVDVLDRVPATKARSQTLIEALERLGRWDDLKATLERLVAKAEGAQERARLAMRLGALYQDRFDDRDEAVSWYRRAFEALPSDIKVVRTYQRSLEEFGRYDELIEALRRELELVSAIEDRRVLVHKKMGSVFADHLGRAEDAAEAFEQALKDAPSDRAVQQRLLSLYKGLERNEALLRVLDVVAEHAENEEERVEALLQAGQVREQMGQDEEAARYYARAFDVRPADRRAFTAVERLCYKLGRWKEALTLYDKAITLVEEDGEPAYRLADLYRRRGQLQVKYLSQPGEAAASYLKVLELEPEDDKTVRFLESIFSKEGDWDGLLGAYERRLELLEENDAKVETLRRAARVAGAKLEDMERASSYYSRLLDLRPDDDEALDALERTYQRARDWNNLANILTLRLDKAKETAVRVELLLRLGQIYEEGMADAERAVDAYRQAAALDQSKVAALEALARIYEATENWAEFVDIARKQIRYTQDINNKSLLYFKCGSVMEAKFGREDDAIRYYKAAIKTSPACLPAVHGLRDLYLRREEWSRVLETLQLEVKIWRDSRERAGVFARIGRIYMEHFDDREKAREHFEAALKLDKESIPALRALFDMAFEEKDWDRCLELAAQIGQRGVREGDPPERSEFLRKRGFVAEIGGDFQEAADHYQDAIEVYPDNFEALEALVQLSRREIWLLDWDEVFRDLEKRYGRKIKPEAQARLSVGRGMLLERQYDVDGAEEQYRKALELAPTSLSVVQSLIALLKRLRRWHDAVSVLEDLVHRSGVGAKARVEALVEAARIMSEGAMDSKAAERLCLRARRLDARHRGALYLLTQELVVQGRLVEALKRCQELIEIAADPNATAPPEELGEYYYYVGRIQETMGDERKAGLSYRRAAELSPIYTPPVKALAMRYAKKGDLSQAESTLSMAARAAGEMGGDEAALDLRRALAALHAEHGQVESAVAELRSIVATDRARSDDRIALARLYSRFDDGMDRAAEELRRVLTEEPANVLATHLLMQVWQRAGRMNLCRRAWRVLELLGRADGQPPAGVDSVPLPGPESAPSAKLPEDVLKGLLSRVDCPFDKLFVAIRGRYGELIPVRFMGENHVPVTEWEDETARTDALWTTRAFGLEEKVDVFAADSVPGGFVTRTSGDRVQVVIDRHFLSGESGSVRFVVAKALAYQTTGYELLARLGPKERNDLAALMWAIAAPEENRQPIVTEFLSKLPRKELKATERIAQAAGEVMLEENPRDWMRSVDLVTDQIALAFVDDILGALRFLAALQQEDLVLESGQTLALLYGVERAWQLVPEYLGPVHDELVSGLLGTLGAL